MAPCKYDYPAADHRELIGKSISRLDGPVKSSGRAKYTYDTIGRITGIIRPDGFSVGFTHDRNGNITLLTTPSLIDHGFGYSGVNLNTSYQTPLSGTYSYMYDKDRSLVQTSFPSGRRIKNIYDRDILLKYN